MHVILVGVSLSPLTCEINCFVFDSAASVFFIVIFVISITMLVRSDDKYIKRRSLPISGIFISIHHTGSCNSLFIPIMNETRWTYQIQQCVLLYAKLDIQTIDRYQSPLWSLVGGDSPYF